MFFTRKLNNSNMFQHAPLDTTRGQIRLLKLSPSLLQGDIRCSIHTVDLSTKPKYRALSYEWGPAEPLRTIRLGASSLSIRHNLWQFLTMFMKAEEDAGFLWIDQICINQYDDQERNHQVKLMGNIYKNAVAVIVWLGHPDPRNLVANKIRHNQVVCQRCRSPCKLQHENPYCESCQHKGSKVRKSYEHYDIIGKSYWTRLWIVQELILARSLSFYYGNTSLHVDEILECCWPVITMFPSEFYDFWFRTHYIRALVEGFHDPAGLTLTDLLVDLDFDLLHCADPRDLVFGLLGLLRESEQLPIDYTWSNKRVFKVLLERLVMSPGLTSYAELGWEHRTQRLSMSLDSLRIRLGLHKYCPEWLSDFQGRPGYEHKSVDFISCMIRLEELGLIKVRWTVPQLVRIASTAWSYKDGQVPLAESRDFDNEDAKNEMRELLEVLNTIDVADLKRFLQMMRQGEHVVQISNILNDEKRTRSRRLRASFARGTAGLFRKFERRPPTVV